MDFNVKDFEESFVVCFGGEFARINAYTLATSLVALADAAKTANSFINPGYNVEVVVEELGAGSFKARLRAIYHGAGNLFTSQDFKSILFSVIATYIYQETLAPDSKINVIVNDDYVIVEHGTERVIIPKEVHTKVTEMEKNAAFRDHVSKMFDAVERDESIKNVAFAINMESDSSPITVTRDRFDLVIRTPSVDDPNLREIIEHTEVQISRAILERGRRRWEFVWRGIRISAPVLDSLFYDSFFEHKITIAPGDSLEIVLKIVQSRDTDTGIYTNQNYEVLQVVRHLPQGRQMKANF